MTRASPPALWWQRPAVVAALVLAVTLPLWFAAPPPLIDLLTHMARYRVQLDLAQSPALQRNWDFHWALIGNLGVDLLVVPLARTIGLERAVWWIVAALPALLAWGMLRSARVIHGRLPGTALAALPFALAYPYQWGFVNFWLGLGIAFHAFAFWPRVKDGWARSLAFAAAGCAVWLCHAFAWGVLGVLAGGYEIALALRQRPFRPLPALGRIAARCWPLTVALIPMIAWRAGGTGAMVEGWFAWSYKLDAVVAMLRDESKPLDIASVFAAVALVWAGLRRHGLRFDARLGVPAALFAALFVVMPFEIFGSAYADMRLAPVVMMVAILALTPREPGGTAERRVAAAAVALLALRLVVGSIGFAAYDRAFASHLRALDMVRAGSRVAALVRTPCMQPWRRERMEHLGSLAVVRRDAFVNTHWATPGAELLVPKGAPGSRFNADPSQFVIDPRHCPDDLRPALAERIAQVPRDRFDYVWVFGFAPAGLPRYSGLRPLYADGASVLYAVAK